MESPTAMTVQLAPDVRDPDKVFERLIDRFVIASERRTTSAFARVRFPTRLDDTCPVWPEHLLSLAGHPALDTLDAAGRWRLGLLETVNFFSLNIHGEQALVGEIAGRLYRQRWLGESPGVSRYLQHFINEENSHTYMLAEFCTRYHGAVMPELVYQFENPPLSRLGRDLLFFGRVFVLETFLDHFNRAAMKDPSLEPTARAVHRSHHLDESVHIAFDRAMLGALCRHIAAAGNEGDIATVATLLRRYADYAFARLVNPRIYRDLGIADPLSVAREVQASEVWLERKARVVAQQQTVLRTLGVAAQ